MLLLRRFVSILLVVFALPALGLFAGAAFAGHRYRVFAWHFDGTQPGGLVAMLSLASVGFGILLLLSIYVSAAICGSNRRLLAATFGPLVRGLSVGVAALGLLQMAVLALSVMMLALRFLHVLPIGLVLPVIAGAFYTAEELARVGLALSSPPALPVTGLAAERSKQPGIWRMLDEVAARLGARAPDHVVFGLAPGFFATGTTVRLPDGRRLSGETLYLSLTSLQLLRERSLLAVIGHELSHFVDDDTRFSLRFAPIYARLKNALGVSYAVRGYGAVTAMPSRVILREAFLAFGKAESRVSRAREIAADAAGARAADGQAMICAIMTTEVSQFLWPAVVRQMIEAINAGEPLFEPCGRLVAMAQVQAHVGSRGAATSDVVRQEAGMLDTHPGLAARAEALGVDVSTVRPFAAARDATPSIDVLEDAAGLALMLRDLFVEWLITSGAARPPRDPSRPNYVQKKRLQRVQQAEARKRRIEASERETIRDVQREPN